MMSLWVLASPTVGIFLAAWSGRAWLILLAVVYAVVIVTTFFVQAYQVTHP